MYQYVVVATAYSFFMQKNKVGLCSNFPPLDKDYSLSSFFCNDCISAFNFSISCNNNHINVKLFICDMYLLSPVLPFKRLVYYTTINAVLSSYFQNCLKLSYSRFNVPYIKLYYYNSKTHLKANYGANKHK